MTTAKKHPKWLDKKDTVAVWVVNKAGKKDIDLDPYYQCLSEDEQHKASRFHFTKDRETYILGRGILRHLLSDFLGKPAKNMPFKYNNYGKPELRLNVSLHFNISHSGELILLSFSKEAPLGIDVELIKKDFDILEIAQNYFSTQEISALKALPESDQYKAFHRCWTRKESFIKAVGHGLSFPLDKFTVSLDRDTEASLLETSWDASEKKQWSLVSYTPAAEYICAIAIRNKLKAVDYYKWDFNL